MLDHMTFRVADMARSKAFYSAVLAPLGYSLLFENSVDGANIVGFGQREGAEHGDVKIDTWLVDAHSRHGQPATTSGCHLAWLAPSRQAVDALHVTALAAGGRDNGAPGVRAHYHAGYDGAFVIDPDGNNVEAVCHAPG